MIEVDGHEGHHIEKVASKTTGVPHWVCHTCEKTLGVACEVFSRVVGYLRPVEGWNKGKQQEFKERKEYKLNDTT